MSEPFILYDIPHQLRDGETEADMSQSPKVFKTRSVPLFFEVPANVTDFRLCTCSAVEQPLQDVVYTIVPRNESQRGVERKGIPFKRVWIDFKHMADVISKLGVEPHEQGNLRYTCPVIYGPSTKRTIMDSQKILEYLEEQYPEKPSLFPPHTRALQVAFIDNIMPRVYRNPGPTPTFDLYGLVFEDSKPYFRDARGKDFDFPLEQLVSHGDVRAKNLAAFQALLENVLQWMVANRENAQ